jgi:hypothetical protein
MTARICGFQYLQLCTCKSKFKGTVPLEASPMPLSIPLGPFQIFQKFLEIFAAQVAPAVLLRPVANRKNLQSEKF